jgi:hypothetical protein
VEIDESIIKKTTKCEKHFACLSKKNHVCCEIFMSFNNEICVIREGKTSRHVCNYKANGFSEVCTCPVRIEMHNKYRK